MKKLITIALLFVCMVAHAQYPNPLPSSGQLSLSQIKAWMVAAGEWPADDPPNFFYTTSLSNAVTYSHLADKATPYKISDFYGYAVPPTFAEHFVSLSSFSDGSGACAYSGDNEKVYTQPQHTTLSTLIQVFTDSSLSTPLEGGYYKYAGQWLEVDANGVIQDLGNCN